MSRTGSTQTFLSSYVYNLVCLKGKESQSGDKSSVKHLEPHSLPWLTTAESRTFLHFDNISNTLQDADDTTDYFESCVEAVIAPLSNSAVVLFNPMTPADFINTCKEDLSWTKCEKVLCDSFCFLQQSKCGNAELSGLLITACLERGLGNLFLLKGTKCPNMLKDVLSSSELKDAIDQNCISLLRILVGPPTSLNLRNILWHGFCLPGEVPEQYWYFLLLVMISIGKKLQVKGVSQIPDRPYVVLREVDELYSCIPEFAVDRGSLHLFLKLSQDSCFISLATMPYLERALTNHIEEKYGMSVTLLLTLLEQCLRSLFATVNNCPERVLTAEFSTLYTTFDEILGQYLADGTENRIRCYLGDGFMDFLHDLFMYEGGPRARDRISHGQCDFTLIPQSLSSILLSLVIALCIHGNQHSEPSIWNETHQAFINYDSRYHPVCILKRQVGKLSRDLLDMNDIPKPDIQVPEAPVSSCVESSAITCCSHYMQLEPQLKELLRYIESGYEFTILQSLLDTRIDTLYRYQKPRAQQDSAGEKSVNELEIVGILRQIVSQSELIVVNLTSFGKQRFLQWEARSMRSRQRNNYLKYLTSLLCLSSGLRLLLVLVVGEMFTLAPSMGSLPKLRFLKQVLQLTENIVSGSCSSKNKWKESVDLVTQLAEIVQTFYQTEKLESR